MTGKSCVWKEECGAGSGVDKQSVTSFQRQGGVTADEDVLPCGILMVTSQNAF